MTRIRAALLAAAAPLALAACGEEEAALEEPVVEVAADLGEAPEGAFGVESEDDYDEYLLEPAGRPAYLFAADTRAEGDQPPELACADECRTIWPPVTVEPDQLQAAEGVDASKLRVWPDGPVENLVTYDGWPLYTYERDDPDAPPYGHAKESYGGQWLLMGVDAQPLPSG
jgi:predicted lipoprotein with Yx(FWY)xxD motif